MPTSNSSMGAKGDGDRLADPGHRSGEGAESVLPFLHDALATRPGELFAEGQARGKPGSTLAGRVRRALARIRKLKGDDANSR